MDKFYKNIEGYDNYKINPKGFVYSDNIRSNLKSIKNKNGYMCVNLCQSGVRKKFRVHRLVAIAFIPNPDSKPCVNHINGNKTDNRAENLEWCTQKENMKHAFKSNLVKIPRGEKRHNSKLSNEDVLNILKMNKIKKITQRKIAEIFGVSQSTIRDIVTRKKWKHLSSDL